MVDGFKLQVAPAVPKVLSVPPGDSDAFLAACEWNTLPEFAAPCAAGGAGKLLTWQGRLEDVAAIRILAPYGHYVDHSAVWLEY
ncbi:MAG: hypothetical protein ACP5G2_01620 [Candidatus Bipolaricaulaceae bacterium]